MPRLLLTFGLAALVLTSACNSSGNETGGDWADGGAFVPRDGGAPRDGGTSTDGGGGGSVDGGAMDGSVADPDAGNVPTTCDTGSLAGRACAPDHTTGVAGAIVAVDSTDCHGNAVHLETHAGSDGSWRVDGLPATEARVTIAVGSFVSSQTARVQAGSLTTLDESKTCFQSTTVRMAVVTGLGDHIETLLQGLGFTPDLIDGKWVDGGVPAAAAFLSDINRVGQYQIVFIDCAAFKRRSNEIDLTNQGSAIASTLRTFVQNGGSLYASDWAAPILAQAFPNQLPLRLRPPDGGSTTIGNPFFTDSLVGYAPQTVTANVASADLAAYLGHSSVSITFPSSPPTFHWAMVGTTLASGVSADIVADVAACQDSACSSRGATQRATPLALSFKPDPARARGGVVLFTSFHNISQATNDVAKILQYMVFRL